MPRVIRDLSDTSSYWAAAWTLCPLPDVHLICDAPIGCFNLVAQAVTDYTDAIPHIENITPSVIKEAEVGGGGTAVAVQRTWEGLRDAGLLDGKQLIVVSTAESEMIGSDLSDLVTKLTPGSRFYHSDSLAEDEWAGRDRVLRWVWEEFGRGPAADLTVEPGLVNIIGPTYGCFNSASDLEEVRRLIEGAGGRINLVYPFEATLADTPRLRQAQVNVVLYKEFGHTLADALGQPWLHAPFGMQASADFVRRLGDYLGTAEQAAAFLRREKRTTLRAVWDLWKGPQGDWFPTTNVGLVASQTYADGLRAYLGDELGMPIEFVASRPLRPGEPDNDAVRRLLHAKPPAFVFGSINEKIYLSEGGARFTRFIPASFPGPIVRRAVGTPFMGFRGAVYVVQEIVNHLYDGLFNFLPVDGAYARQRTAGTTGAGSSAGAPTATNGAAPTAASLPWQAEARERLDAALEKLPFLPRISASREMQMRADALAQARKLTEVTAEIVDEVLAARPL